MDQFYGDQSYGVGDGSEPRGYAGTDTVIFTWWYLRGDDLPAGRNYRRLLQCVHQPRNDAVQIFVRSPQLFNLINRMQHGGVMLPAELPANFRQRRGGQLLHDVHRHLARERDGARVTANFQILFAKIEMLTDALLDQVDGHALFLRRDDVAQNLLRGGQGDGCAGQRSVGHQACQGAFELANVGLDGAGDVFGDVI